VSYRASLAGRALSQFRDLVGDQDADTEPEFRQAEFGEHGLPSFRVDEQAETLAIFSIIWVG
jgi:hypothetical protein